MSQSELATLLFYETNLTNKPLVYSLAIRLVLNIRTHPITTSTHRDSRENIYRFNLPPPGFDKGVLDRL